MQVEVNRFRPYHLILAAKKNGNFSELRNKGTSEFTKKETGTSKMISKMPETASPGRRFPADQAWVLLIGRRLPGAPLYDSIAMVGDRATTRVAPTSSPRRGAPSGRPNHILLALPPQEPLYVPYQVFGVENGAGGHALVVLSLQLGDV